MFVFQEKLGSKKTSGQIKYKVQIGPKFLFDPTSWATARVKLHFQLHFGSWVNPITVRGGVFRRTPSNFAAFGDPLKVKYLDMFYAGFSYLSIY